MIIILKGPKETMAAGSIFLLNMQKLCYSHSSHHATRLKLRSLSLSQFYSPMRVGHGGVEGIAARAGRCCRRNFLNLVLAAARQIVTRQGVVIHQEKKNYFILLYLVPPFSVTVL